MKRNNLLVGKHFWGCRQSWTALCILFIFAFVSDTRVEAQAYLHYQDRVGYHEGIRGEEVAGERVELTFAMASYQESATNVPSQLRLRFYLYKKDSAFPVVHERKEQLYYWLDQVVWSKQPIARAWNEFIWPTDPVIKPLIERDNFNWKQLVAIVRLGTDFPQRDEYIAPVIFYHHTLPSSINSYIFGFKCNFKANIRCEVFPSDSAIPVMTQNPLSDPGELFTIKWNAGNAKAGMYNMVITASNTKLSIKKTIKFYHQPKVQ